MERKIVLTSDGSTTIFLEDWKEHYHSKHGAIQEAYHVFIKQGLDSFKKGSELEILEIGFGTGLNCFITYLESVKRNLTIKYQGVEAYPLKEEEIGKLNYIERLGTANSKGLFSKIHEIKWGEWFALNSNFQLMKRKEFFEDLEDRNQFDLIYFDAFGARVQPELWTVEIFNKMYNALKKNGILVTYSAKGSVRRAMQEVGFKVERLPGPPGKREMLRGKVL